MSKSPPRPVLLRRVNLIWYALAIVPLLALLYLSFTGVLPQLVAMLALFLIVFWLLSFGFALYETFRKKPEPRQ